MHILLSLLLFYSRAFPFLSITGKRRVYSFNLSHWHWPTMLSNRSLAKEHLAKFTLFSTKAPYSSTPWNVSTRTNASSFEQPTTWFQNDVYWSVSTILSLSTCVTLSRMMTTCLWFLTLCLVVTFDSSLNVTAHSVSFKFASTLPKLLFH